VVTTVAVLLLLPPMAMLGTLTRCAALVAGSEAFDAVRQLAACLPAPLGGKALNLAAALRLVVLAQQVHVCTLMCVCARMSV